MFVLSAVLKFIASLNHDILLITCVMFVLLKVAIKIIDKTQLNPSSLQKVRERHVID